MTWKISKLVVSGLDSVKFFLSLSSAPCSCAEAYAGAEALAQELGASARGNRSVEQIAKGNNCPVGAKRQCVGYIF